MFDLIGRDISRYYSDPNAINDLSVVCGGNLAHQAAEAGSALIAWALGRSDEAQFAAETAACQLQIIADGRATPGLWPSLQQNLEVLAAHRSKGAE